jgi:hypothetical protein
LAAFSILRVERLERPTSIIVGGCWPGRRSGQVYALPPIASLTLGERLSSAAGGCKSRGARRLFEHVTIVLDSCGLSNASEVAWLAWSDEGALIGSRESDRRRRSRYRSAPSVGCEAPNFPSRHSCWVRVPERKWPGSGLDSAISACDRFLCATFLPASRSL